MWRQQSKAKAGAAPADGRAPRKSARHPHQAGASHGAEGGTWSGLFGRIANSTAHAMGKPITFLIACALVVVWAATGPMFGYSDTWQLVINTSTTIVTFLMVFLIQNTQNRDTMALQLKLSELILAVQDAENRFAEAEDLTEEELEKLHQELHRRAEDTLEALNQRRARTRQAS
jgi:low affinity Fe/Cu permease